MRCDLSKKRPPDLVIIATELDLQAVKGSVGEWVDI